VSYVWAVHAVLAGEIRPTQGLFADEGRALAYAEQLSTDDEVLAAVVTRFAVDELGTRRNVAMYVHGQRQEVPHLSNCGRIHGGGRGPK
jgi:hypothetical protein